MMKELRKSQKPENTKKNKSKIKIENKKKKTKIENRKKTKIENKNRKQKKKTKCCIVSMRIFYKFVEHYMLDIHCDPSKKTNN